MLRTNHGLCQYMCLLAGACRSSSQQRRKIRQVPFFIRGSVNLNEICELLLLPSHCAVFVAQFGIPQVSLMKDHSHLP